MALSQFAGIYCPEDLKILQRVFDQVCAERRIFPADDTGSAEYLGAQIVALSNFGVANEAGLLQALRQHDRGRVLA